VHLADAHRARRAVNGIYLPPLDGFDVTFDVHTGEILAVKPGLDCIVC
jgi:hypothetical protein